MRKISGFKKVKTTVGLKMFYRLRAMLNKFLLIFKSCLKTSLFNMYQQLNIRISMW